MSYRAKTFTRRILCRPIFTRKKIFRATFSSLNESIEISNGKRHSNWYFIFDQMYGWMGMGERVWEHGTGAGGFSMNAHLHSVTNFSSLLWNVNSCAISFHILHSLVSFAFRQSQSFFPDPFKLSFESIDICQMYTYTYVYTVSLSEHDMNALYYM